MRFLELLREALWGWHVLLLILTAGVYFSFAGGFFQLRRMGQWLKTAVRGPKRQGKGGGVSQFQALTAALAGSIGVGNIVGVAAAITVGGLGSLFWMWVSSIFGMMTVFSENLLAARHRGAPGALGYIEKAGKWGKQLAVLYAAGCCLSSFGMGNMAQTNAAAVALESFGVAPQATGLLTALLVFFVARGGLGFAVKITEKLVPAMTLLFFGASLGVLWIFRDNLPGAFRSIFEGAFSLKAGAGGTAGMLIALKVGVSRGVFTNEAGLGSSAFAYEDVRDRTPVELGCMGIFQVFVDTLVMCTVTGLCILCCRSPMLEGAQLTFFAYESALGAAGSGAVSLCTALFALATLVAWCCYGREGLFYLTKGKGKNLFALVSAIAAFLGCVLPLTAVFQLGDAFNGMMALPNVLALFLFSGEIREQLAQEKGTRRALLFSAFNDKIKADHQGTFRRLKNAGARNADGSPGRTRLRRKGM